VIAVLFEVWPHLEGRQAYLDIAAALRSRLDTMDGFVSIERFQSLSDSSKLLSLSFWRDEAAVAAWRRLEAHREAHSTGRELLFADYRLRIASVLRDYGKLDRAEAPVDSRALHDRSQPAPGRP
jgi:heme-degrading monooxygenase HmoA